MIPVKAGFDVGRWLANGNSNGSWERFNRNVQASVALHALTGAAGDGPNSCLEPWEMLRMITVAAGVPHGTFVEVGVFWGGSAYYLKALAQRQGRALCLYDTFEGLPCADPIDEMGVGVLKVDEAVVRKSLGEYPTIVKGVFPHVNYIPEGVAFAHIDVDQYRCTLETIAALRGRMIPGGIMWFDDTNSLEGARQAVRESFPSHAIEIDPETNRWWTRF